MEQTGATKVEYLMYGHSNPCLLLHSNLEYKKGFSRMWNVEFEISNLNMTLNALTHLNLLEDVTPLVQPSNEVSNISRSLSSIHEA